MQILTISRAREAAFDCDAWSNVAPNATREDVSRGGFRHDVYESPLRGDFDRAVEALLVYKVFGQHRMIAHVCTPDSRIALNATIVQRVLLGPVALETAVRVIELEKLPSRVSFAYATLQGHPERGVASFAVVRDKRGVRFQAQAWSRAGNWLATVGRPVSRALQTAFTREAVASFCAGRCDCPCHSGRAVHPVPCSCQIVRQD